MPNYTRAVGHKFHADGSPRLFPGNTIIAFVPESSPHFKLCEWAHSQVQALPLARKFSFLPPSSFHMTVKELLCDEMRTPTRWSSELALDAPLAETDAFFIDAVATVAPPRGVAMRFSHVARQSNLMIYLEPADVEAAQAVWAYRDAVAAATGTRFADHIEYEFHISLAYRLIELSDEEERRYQKALDEIDARLGETFNLFVVPSPQLTFFDDMTRFVTAEERGQLISRSERL